MKGMDVVKWEKRWMQWGWGWRRARTSQGNDLGGVWVARGAEGQEAAGVRYFGGEEGTTSPMKGRHQGVGEKSDGASEEVE
jgi:hypothetical protein